jgi:hypothetical protein
MKEGLGSTALYEYIFNVCVNVQVKLPANRLCGRQPVNGSPFMPLLPCL